VPEAEPTFMEDGFATAQEAGRTPEPSLLALYGTLADRQRRLAEPLGWQRTARDVTDKATEPVPTLTRRLIDLNALSDGRAVP
jgi:hypothetical protein